jgi:hypothetical protein
MNIMKIRMAMKKKDYIIILFCLFAFTNTVPVFAQADEEVTVISPYMEFKYLKNTNNQRTLNAGLFEATGIGLVPLPGLRVKFYTNMEEMELLGEALTNNKGIASYIIPDNMKLPVDEENNWWFYAEFEGAEGIEMAMEELTLMDVHLGMTLTENDEEGRLVHLTAYTLVDGEKVPVTDEDIYVFVPRMFSMLPVGEGYFEDGEAVIEFPGDIPGDEHGKLTVIGRFEDHWQFANVEKRIDTNWGVPSSHEIAETHRALWTQIAPLWMIITLSVMLVGVWGHYLFAIISIIRIKRTGNKLDANK